MKLDGIIVLNKERGISSNNLVNKVKYLLQADKAGHLGTLDVLGEGLLPITLGKGTKLFDYFLNKDKVYKTIFKFGETSITLDTEGEIIEQDNNVFVTEEDVMKIIPNLLGKQMQMPPLYSAKKVNGQKAYELARQGKTNVDLKAKEIEIYSIKLLSNLGKNTFEFEIHCSSGTYIRSICRDMASLLSTCGIMLYIKRTVCGDFKIEDAYNLKDIESGNYKIISLDTIFNKLDSIFLNEEQSTKLLNGVSLNYLRDGEFKAYFNNKFLGIVKTENGIMSFVIRLC